MDKKKKPTKKLDVQELEKRKAPFASPMYQDGSGGTESVGSRRAPEPDSAPQTPGRLPRTPIIDRHN